jgi:uncharacterized membrane protein YeaQ/YmgE (transglycosylase-associated protein family)
MNWLEHLLIGALMGFTVSLIAGTKSAAHGWKNVAIGALSASVAGAFWSPFCAQLQSGLQTGTLAPLWSMGVAMLAVIGNNELRRTN